MTITLTPHDEHPRGYDDKYPEGFYDHGEPIRGTTLAISAGGVKINGRIVFVPTDPLLGEIHKWETPDGNSRYTRLSIEVTA